MTTKPLLALLVLLVLLTAASGCQSINTGWMPKAPWSKKDKLVESNFDTPVRMAAIWTPDVLVRPGAAPTRGVGGRLYFYNQSNKPIQVEGQLVVYAYDDSAKESQHESPDRKYAFTPEQFTQHHSQSELGPSYSVWLPWDSAVEGQQASVSLLPVFTATSGKIVMGQQAINLLAGKKPESRARPGQPTLSSTAATGVRPANFQNNTARNGEPPAVVANVPQTQTSTATIALPRSMQQRLAAAAQNPPATPRQASAADPAMVQKANAALQEIRANSSLRESAGAPSIPIPSTRFEPPRPRIPSSSASPFGSAHVPSRPHQPGSQFGPLGSPTPTMPMVAGGFDQTGMQYLR